MRLKSANYKSHWNILVFYNQWKLMSDLNMSRGKMSDFVSFPLYGLTLVIKLRNFDFEGHSNTLTFLMKKDRVSDSHKTEKFRFWKSFKYFYNFWWKKDMVSDLNMSYRKMSDFVSFPLGAIHKGCPHLRGGRGCH